MRSTSRLAIAAAIAGGVWLFFLSPRAQAAPGDVVTGSGLTFGIDSGATVAVPDEYQEDVAGAAAAYGVPVGILARLLYTESRFNPDAYNASSGAIGMAQFLQATADWLGIDPHNASDSIWGAAKYLQYLFNKFHTWYYAVAAYNWGEGNIAKLIAQGYVVTSSGTKLTQPPAETRTYVAFITGSAAA